MDADQAHAEYPFFGTLIGRRLYEAYLDVYRKYYEDEKWGQFPSQFEKKPLLAPVVHALPSSSLSSDARAPLFERVEVERSPFSQPSAPPFYPELQAAPTELVELRSHQGHVLPSPSRDIQSPPPVYSPLEPFSENVLERQPVVELLSPRRSLYAPILCHESDRRQRTLFKRIFCCFFKAEKIAYGKVKFEDYDDVLYRGLRSRVMSGANYSAMEVLSRGARVRDGIVRKTFYAESDIQREATPLELCEYISSHWDVELDILLPLIHYTAKRSDASLARMIGDEIRRISALNRKNAKADRTCSLLIGDRCSGCAYDQVCRTQRPHYHSQLLDNLFLLDSEVFKRLTLLAFDILDVPINILRE